MGFTDTKYFGQSCDDVSPDEVEIGWMITPSAWGQGYATEAGSAVRDEAFDRLELESIVAVHHPENAASRSGEARHDVRAERRGQERLAVSPLPLDTGPMDVDAMRPLRSSEPARSR